MKVEYICHACLLIETEDLRGDGELCCTIAARAQLGSTLKGRKFTVQPLGRSARLAPSSVTHGNHNAQSVLDAYRALLEESKDQ